MPDWVIEREKIRREKNAKLAEAKASAMRKSMNNGTWRGSPKDREQILRNESATKKEADKWSKY